MIAKIANIVNVPAIVGGGYGHIENLRDMLSSVADAVAFSDAIHCERTALIDLREAANQMGCLVGTL